MEKYKPNYLGKTIPTDDTPKLTDLLMNKYDAFSKIYDVCKDNSDTIKDIKVIEKESNSKNSLSIKLSTDQETIKKIKEKNKDESIDISGDVVTAE